MKEFRILINSMHIACVSVRYYMYMQCMCLWIFIVHEEGVDKKYFWTWNKITTVLLFIQIQYSPFQTHFSRLTYLYSLFQTHLSRLTFPDSFIQTHFSRLTYSDSLFQTHLSRLTYQDSVIQTHLSRLTYPNLLIQTPHSQKYDYNIISVFWYMYINDV